MTMNNLKSSLKKSCSNIKLQAKKNSPEILMGIGIVGTVVGTVLACNATLKATDVIDEAKKKFDDIEKAKDIVENEEDYTEKDEAKDIAVTYIQAGVKLAKLYAPSVIVFGLSYTGIIKSHCILKKRNAAIAAACVTINEGFKDYRKRVVERFGDDIDTELRTGIKAQKVKEKVVDPETGEEKKVKKTVNTIDEVPSYAYVVDRSCDLWDPDPDYTRMLLNSQQKYANHKLVAEGHLFINDVLKGLGVKEDKRGQVCGWVYKPEDPTRDSFVNFRAVETIRQYEDGTEDVIFLLDFNDDGPILDYLG